MQLPVKNMMRRFLTLLFVSIFLIVLGAVLTVSLVFIFIGIPLLIVGVVLLIIILLSFFSATVVNILGFFRNIFHSIFGRREKVTTTKAPKDRIKIGNKKVIDVVEKEGIFEEEKQ